MCLVRHFVQISSQLVQLCFQLPFRGSNGLAHIVQISQAFIGVSKLLLSRATLSISSIQESTGFLQSISHCCCLSICCNLCIRGSRLSRRLLLHLVLSISDLKCVLLDGGLRLCVASNGVF